MFMHRIELTGRFTPKDVHSILNDSQDRTPRKLWRFDELNGKQYLLIVSELETINSSRLGNIQSKPYDEFLRRLENNQQWRFRLAANPTVCRNGKRLPLTISGQLKWLSKRSAGNGFELLSYQKEEAPEGNVSCQIVRSDNFHFRKADRNIVTVRVSEFEGTLKITDADLLRDAMTTGIGHAKAYGCGLMTLARM